MMRTIRPYLADLTIFDPGNVPELWIDGLAYQFAREGVVHTGLFSTRPALRGVAAGTLMLRYACLPPAIERMRAQSLDLVLAPAH